MRAFQRLEEGGHFRSEIESSWCPLKNRGRHIVEAEPLPEECDGWCSALAALSLDLLEMALITSKKDRFNLSLRCYIPPEVVWEGGCV